MKILYAALGFGINDNLGGSVRVAAQNAKALVDKGNEVLFLCTNRKDRNTKLFTDIHTDIIDKVEVIYLNTRCIPYWPGDFGPHYVKIPDWVIKKIKSCQIIHLHEYRSYLSYKLTKIGNNFSIPVLMYPQGTFSNHSTKGFIKKMYDIFFLNGIKKKYKYYIACTNSESKEFIKSGINKEAIRILPNGINLNNNKSIYHESNNFREKYMGNDSAPFFLSIGRLDHIKGFDLMIKAMPKIPSNWKYVIVGPDQQNYSIALKKIIFNLGLENRVIITGALPNKLDVQNALNECSFLVVPSYYEAFGQVILEGFLAKKAIIISKGCRISSDISSDIATLVEPNRNELSTACNRYIENRTLTQLHAVQGYNFCIEKFELSNVIQKLINIYIEVLHT